MIKNWINWINYTTATAVVFLLVAAAVFTGMRPTEFPVYDSIARKPNLPKNAFTRSPGEYESIASPALSIDFSPLYMEMPDLRRHLIYYGKNGRPDTNQEQPTMHFAFAQNKIPSSLEPGKRLYILYDKKQTPPQYVFSPNNNETHLWIEAKVSENQALITIGMKFEDEHGEESIAYSELQLPEKEYVRFGNAVWEMGNFRVDGTLLARQKARWYGLDRFLEKHGGNEFEEMISKHRVDFGEGDDAYSVYLGVGSYLIWKDNRWQNVKAGDVSLNSPILSVKKIEDRIMNLELWDVDGKGKIVLNLIRSNEAWTPKNLEEQFKFIGARTKSQLIFEVKEERMLLRPNDWLVLTETGWKKLETPDEIDQYVERKLVGPLFVFDQIERKDDRQVISGTLFNAARTEMMPMELSLQQNVTAIAKKQLDEKKQRGREGNHTPMVKIKTPNINVN